MENSNYKKAYCEVLEILQYVPKDDQNKIPKDILDTMKENADEDYRFHMDTNISFDKQNLMSETKAILANFYRDYWATDFQREQIIIKEKMDRQKREDDLNKKYSYDNLFKNKEKRIEDNMQMIEYKETIFRRIINKILNILHLK